MPSASQTKLEVRLLKYIEQVLDLESLQARLENEIEFMKSQVAAQTHFCGVGILVWVQFQTLPPKQNFHLNVLSLACTHFWSTPPYPFKRNKKRTNSPNSNIPLLLLKTRI